MASMEEKNKRLARASSRRTKARTLRPLASRNSVRLRPDRSFWQKPESAMHMCPFRVPDLFATAALQEPSQRPKAPNSWPNGLCQQNRDTAFPLQERTSLARSAMSEKCQTRK
jgi:hypothetical protein